MLCTLSEESTSERSFYFVFELSHVQEHSGENVFWEKRAPTRTCDKERRDMKHKLKASQRIQM